MERYPKDHAYFNRIDTEEKAYLLGLLYADGSVCRRKVRIELHENDRAILERFSMAIFGQIRLTEKPAKTTVYKDRTICASRHFCLDICSMSIVQQVAKLGLMPKKSTAHGFPSTKVVPEYLVRHFVRGYFDGDGSISHKGSVFYLSILSSQSFCDHLTKLAYQELSVTFRPVKMKANISGIRTSGNPQIKRFLDWLYKDATIYLARKHEVYLQLSERSQEVTDNKYSKHPYISFRPAVGQWCASVYAGGSKRTVHLGHFDSEEEAIAAQQEYVTKHGLGHAALRKRMGNDRLSSVVPVIV